ncbi:MAG: ABC transporter permease subunit [Methanobacteriota archaeon]|nr:MAG: ABC transporter permease subunit [Euryarchaeota archaeon]
MRIRKSWIVAKKDMAEFRTNRYIIFTILLMPTIMGVIVPVTYFLPIQLFAEEESGPPLDIKLTTNYDLDNHTVFGGNFTNASFQNMVVINSVIDASRVRNTTLRFVVVNNSVLDNVSLEHCIIIGSNIYNLESREGVILEGSSIVSEESSERTEITLSMLNFLLFFYMIIPAVIPTFIASYSFVGEKNNRSLEPLLATPTTDLELLLGKTLSIFVVTMAATWISYGISTVLVDLLAFPLLGYYPLPNALWLIGFLVLAPLFCILSISLNVLVSSKVTDVRASQQIGGLIVLPVLVFVFLTFAGPAFSSAWMMVVYSIIFFAIDAAVVFLSTKVFRREEILTRWK